MSMVEDIQTKLTGITTDIYYNDLPSEGNVIGLYNSGGPPTTHSLDSIVCEKMSLQTRVRHESTSTAILWCEQIKDALDGLHTEIINGNLYIQVFQEGDTLGLGKDDRNRSHYSVNFMVSVKFA